MPSGKTSDLELVSIVQHMEHDQPVRSDEPRLVILQDKIAEYIEKIGAESPHLFGIMIQLLTHGKVRVDFRTYSERLELKNMQDRLPRAKAIEFMDTYLYKQDREESTFNRTHNIVIPRLKNER